MAVFGHVVRQVLAILLPGTVTSVSMASHPVEPSPPPQTPSALMQRMEADPATRERFARDPAAAFRATGVDTTSFAFREGMSEGEVSAALERWAALQSVSGQAAPAMVASENDTSPAPVYGPPPGLAPTLPRFPPVKPPPRPDSADPAVRVYPPPLGPPSLDRSAPPSPPVAVYGPPPG